YARTFERAVDHVTPEEVGAQEVRTGVEQGLATVECHTGEGRRVARLSERLRLEAAVEDGARLARCQGVGFARRIDPADRVHQRDEEIDADNGNRPRTPPPDV